MTCYDDPGGVLRAGLLLATLILGCLGICLYWQKQATFKAEVERDYWKQAWLDERGTEAVMKRLWNDIHSEMESNP